MTNNENTAKAMDISPKPEHSGTHDRHHECEGAGDIGIGAAELRKVLDHFPVRVDISRDVSRYPDTQSPTRDVGNGCFTFTMG